MRQFLLWAGQWLLYGLWVLGWPIILVHWLWLERRLDWRERRRFIRIAITYVAACHLVYGSLPDLWPIPLAIWLWLGQSIIQDAVNVSRFYDQTAPVNKE